ncbi:ATP-binding protein [Salmonella enterica]|uniref:ATP-binding protein n=1 Tax=Salmonella enterica TaxID=28901 RepID=A0A704QZY1_SALER|nr:ATP-binding protein [Salmonella enterica]EEN1073592.1 ATP-binding protein [Salmonella enterica subsp. enterica]OSD44390.1 hypothetical protein R533_11610 [Salmonella enterica subsp. houtenae serovar 40:z4,z32:-]EAT4616144.1 ATP-binding protein [Salmonella enterica]EAX5944626.1 ATP-binding protein [Salmonella enterica]
MQDASTSITSEQEKINHILMLENEISFLSEGENASAACEAARDALVEAIKDLCSISGSYSGSNLERILGKVETATDGHRDVAIILIRCLSVDGLIPIDDTQSVIIRKLISLFETYVPDVLKLVRLDKKQNFEKINLIRTIHSTVCNNYAPLNQISGSLEEIASQKPTILKCLKHKGFQAYLQPFNFITIRAKIESLMEAIETHLSSTGADYKTSLDELERIITETDITIQSSTSFFTKKYATPLLSVIKDTVEAIKDTASEMLCSSIELQRKPPKSAEKKYPLHQVDRLIKIIIPFVNKGPGTAVDVNIEVDTGKESAIIFNNEQFRCGDVPPGNFAICLEANVLAATKKIDIILELNWKEIFGSNKSQIYEIVVEGQNEHVDWNQLENLEPYSLEVAEGDMFVGRDAKVKAIVNKLLKRPMTSTYVTGQKRIGKTSLAKAVINYLEEECKDFHCLYLEYGEYCSATPQKTLKSLGENIYNFMLGFIPGNHQQDPDFSESLADLNLTAKTLESKCPDKKFIIVLDEFDEIHPELYRSGPLAETFFANLRTLAARKNMAFLLVGGEKMPFIIGAQGDQLNKFSRETLDYFSRSSEWAEYIELIRKPVEGYLNWDDAAINKIFNITHGHPYYTKLLCSKIVSIAISERDTEIIESDVTNDMIYLLPELDTNSFAHLWKDGISSERDQAEVIELKRLRLLVSIGRSIREHKRNEEDIKLKATFSQLLDHEISPLITDFQRREIIYENKKDLFFTIPLFENWLTEYGLNKLITSTLGDELEAGIKKAEDKAHVTSGEIQQLIEDWPLYRAQKIDGERVRAWLDQIPDILSQRLAFKLLKNLRFIRPVEIDEYLKDAHTKLVKKVVGVSTIYRKTDRRSDFILTFCDGVGKSGSQYARIYAKNNAIATSSILDPTALVKKLKNLDADSQLPKAIVLVDDVIGSGETLSSGINNLLELIGEQLITLKIPMLVITIVGTEDGESVVNSTLKKHSEDNELYIAELLNHSNYAFIKENLNFWENEEEMHRAKSLCLGLGAKLYKKPLGYNDQGLLLVLPETCPNNSLPILFQTKVGANAWNPLFPRPVS